MISRKLTFLVILVILSSFAQAKDKCPLQCDCSEDLSVVKCRDMEKFPVFNFARKVKTLDLTYGNIRNIHAKEVTPYTNLENLFISHNPLDCDHATTYTLKYVLRDTMKLKSFDGHKIKCPKLMPLMGKPLHGLLAASGNIHYGDSGQNVHIHALTGHHPLHCMTPGMVATVVFCTMMGVIAVAGICWLIALLVAAKKKVSNADDIDPVSQMEDGTSTATQSLDTTAEALMKGLQKQRRSSQGLPENAIVDSKEDDVVDEKEYLKEKMKKQRRLSQGYADGSGSSDEDRDIVEINLND